MRFMTLTTAPTSKRTLRRSFEVLRKRIRRATMEKCGFNGFKLNRYFCLRTREGHGVLHIIFWGGRYIPNDWLSRTWEKIHGAHQVNIEYVHKKRHRVNSLTGYLIDRYLQKQPIERMSYGWMWAWLGFCKSWQHVKDVYGMLKTPSFNTAPKKGYEGFKGWYRNASVQAWKMTLWEPPKSSRKTVLTKEKFDLTPKRRLGLPAQRVVWLKQTEVLWF